LNSYAYVIFRFYKDVITISTSIGYKEITSIV